MIKYTTEEFIEKAKAIHGIKYNYDGVIYTGSKNKITVKCIEHNYNFDISPNHLLRGAGCTKCSGNYKYTTEEFIEKAKIIHGARYEYTNFVYSSSHIKSKITCMVHGDFEQKPHEHIAGKGCKKCNNYKHVYDNNFFIPKATAIHNNKYDYSLVEYINTKTKVDIICIKHGIFKQYPSIHLNYGGCPKCKTSIGEMKIENYLTNNNIKYVTQYTFDACKNKRLLKYDFYLPDYNLCIEYDGIQHTKPVKKFGGKKGFMNQKINDGIKDKFCYDNKIGIIRITYNECYKKKLDDFFKIESTYKEIYYSAFDKTIGLINEYLLNIDILEYSYFINDIKHHYKSNKSASDALRKYFGNLIPDYFLMKENGKWFIKKI